MLPKLLRSIPFAPRPAGEQGRALYAAAAAQARNPAFYTALEVADSPEGRFELYALHVILILHRLKGLGPEAAEIAQATFDRFVSTLDAALRDLNVGDLSVGKKMRKLGEAFYGRVRSYDEAFAARPDLAPLRTLIGRTVFEEREVAGVDALTRYAAAAADALAATPFEDVRSARLAWPDPLAGEAAQ